MTRSPLARTTCTAAATPPGWPTMSLAFSMTWLKPASRIAASLADSSPASVIVSMPKSSK